MAWYYGSDGSTSGFPTCTGAAPPFYIGRIGGGITGGKNSVFNTTTAGQAGYLQTFAYWDLEGPDLKETGDTMTQWGTAQAQAFVDAWVNGYYKDYVGGSTFFLDIEFGNNGGQGWGTPSTPAGTLTERQQILIGALDYLSNQENVTGIAGSAGVYISADNWTVLFGDYTSPYPYVFWFAGTDSPDCTEAPTQLSTYPAASVGGWKTMLWQFEASDTIDYDITPYEGYYLKNYWTPVQA